jgi:hypothetical protein
MELPRAVLIGFPSQEVLSYTDRTWFSANTHKKPGPHPKKSDKNAITNEDGCVTAARGEPLFAPVGSNLTL